MKSRKRKLLNYLLLITGLSTCLSGVMMQIGYHIGVTDRTAIAHIKHWGMNLSQWQITHQAVASLFFILCGLHVYLHWGWYKGVIGKRLFKRNSQLLTFTLLFIVSALLGFAPWAISNGEALSKLRHILIEIHDKVSVVLIVFMVLHVVKRWKRIHGKRAVKTKSIA